MGKSTSHSDNLFVAIKVIPKTKKGNFSNGHQYLNLIKKEIAIMKKLNHPNVVRLLEVIEDPFDQNVYLIMEYCYGHVKWRRKSSHQTNGHPNATPEDFDSIFRSNSFSISDSSDEEDFSMNSPVLWTDQDTNPYPEENEDFRHLEPHREMYNWSEQQSGSQFYVGDHFSTDSDESIEYVAVLSEDQARYIIKQVISGLDYLHYQGVIHRDIKPANLLYTYETNEDNEKQLIVKITDFGVSHFSPKLQHDQNNPRKQIEEDPELEKTVGSPAFFAPELCVATDELHTPIKYDDEPHPLIDDPSYKVYITKSIDIWALGVTLYCLIYGQVPFTAANEYELLDIIPKQELEFPPGGSEECKNLLKKLLEKRWDKRITLDEIKVHPWIIKEMTEEQVTRWLAETSPSNYDVIEVTQNEVENAFTIMDKLKRGVRRLSSSFSNMVVDFKKAISRRGSMTELHMRSPHPSEPRLSTSLSSRGANSSNPQIQKAILSPLPSQQSFKIDASGNGSSINMSIESENESDKDAEKNLGVVLE
eukprot:NODE_33_length_36935_cov_1.609241.p4 type:complete len:533 gc:universal NODE_33_length_36935_cov_1.609241:23310-21712(-)